MTYNFPKGRLYERLPEVVKTNNTIFKYCLDVSRMQDVNKENDIVGYLEGIVAGGNEICTDMGLNWSYPSYAAILALAKRNTRIWNRLSVYTQNKIDLLARCLLVALNGISNDANAHCCTGLGLNGNTCRYWSPNHMLSLVAPYIFLRDFFGSTSDTNGVLEDFDYNQYLSEIETAGFVNIQNVWTTTKTGIDGQPFGAAQMLTYHGQSPLNVKIVENGNVIDYGTLQGFNADFTFMGRVCTDAIFWNLINKTFRTENIIDSSVEKSGVTCGILDGTTSPYEGQPNECIELDYGQDRSCLYHAAVTATMCIETFAAIVALGSQLADDENQASCQIFFDKIKNGIDDIFYKLDHGYHCYDFFNEYDMDYAKVNQIWPAVATARVLWNDLKLQFQ